MLKKKSVFHRAKLYLLILYKNIKKKKKKEMRKILKDNRKNMEYVTDFIKLKTIFSKTQ